MNTFNRTIRQGQYIEGVECFTLTGDKKNPKHRVAYYDYKLFGHPTSTGTCKCGGKIMELMHSPASWIVCEKCGKDYSIHSFPRRLVWSSGHLP